MCAPAQEGPGSSRVCALRHELGILKRQCFPHCIHPGPAVGPRLGTLLTGMSDLSSLVSHVHLQCNQIHHGLRSGIVVLGNGKGIIRNNQIFSNKEAGIYILYHGNPIVRYALLYPDRPAPPRSLFPLSSLFPYCLSFFHLKTSLFMKITVQTQAKKRLYP